MMPKGIMSWMIRVLDDHDVCVVAAVWSPAALVAMGPAMLLE